MKRRGGHESLAPSSFLDRMYLTRRFYFPLEEFVNGFNRQKAGLRRCRFGRPIQ